MLLFNESTLSLLVHLIVSANKRQFTYNFYFFLFPCRANLSRDYFIDRQDRYFLFENCPELTDFFADLVNCMADHSFSLQRDGSTRRPKACSIDPLSSRKTAKQFRTSLASSVKKLIQPASDKDSIKSQKAYTDLDTVVYPLVQMGHYGIYQDELATQRLLASVGAADEVHLASGYFNLPPQYINAIFRGKGKCHVLAASPQVNQNSYTGIYMYCIL